MSFVVPDSILYAFFNVKFVNNIYFIHAKFLIINNSYSIKSMRKILHTLLFLSFTFLNSNLFQISEKTRELIDKDLKQQIEQICTSRNNQNLKINEHEQFYAKTIDNIIENLINSVTTLYLTIEEFINRSINNEYAKITEIIESTNNKIRDYIHDAFKNEDIDKYCGLVLESFYSPTMKISEDKTNPIVFDIFQRSISEIKNIIDDCSSNLGNIRLNPIVKLYFICDGIKDEVIWININTDHSNFLNILMDLKESLMEKIAKHLAKIFHLKKIEDRNYDRCYRFIGTREIEINATSCNDNLKTKINTIIKDISREEALLIQEFVKKMFVSVESAIIRMMWGFSNLIKSVIKLSAHNVKELIDLDESEQ